MGCCCNKSFIHKASISRSISLMSSSFLATCFVTIGVCPLCYKISLQAFFRQDGFWNPDFSVLVYTSLVNFMGLYSLPPQYYIFLFAVAASCLGLMTVEKKSTQRKTRLRIKKGESNSYEKKVEYTTISRELAGFLIKSLNSDEFKSTGLENEKSELKTSLTELMTARQILLFWIVKRPRLLSTSM